MGCGCGGAKNGTNVPVLTPAQLEGAVMAAQSEQTLGAQVAQAAAATPAPAEPVSASK